MRRRSRKIWVFWAIRYECGTRIASGHDPTLEGCVTLQRLRSLRSVALVATAAGGLALAVPAAAFASTAHHQAPPQNLKLNQVNLASDIPGMAPVTDPD